MLPLRPSRPTLSKASRTGKPVTAENVQPAKEDCVQTKRSPSSPQGGAKKRSAFGDITNEKIGCSLQTKPTLGNRANKNQQQLHKKKDGQKAAPKKTRNIAVNGVLKNNEIKVRRAPRKVAISDVDVGLVKEEKISNEDVKSEPKVETSLKRVFPPDVEDIDKDSLDDPFCSSEYAEDIFAYMHKREEKFVLSNYMESQKDISKEMRAILVDWMVEVQENFELNHETLYLAVKLVDHYLAVSVIVREKLQLIGSTTVLIASKFEERCPPCLDDFLYICDDAYKKEELIAMEMDILQKLNFDINIPVPYRFLRRFGKCAHASMETLTLARYICELTLQDYDFVQEGASKMAASCLLLALKMKDLGEWTATLRHYSGYQAMDLLPLVKRLNFMIMCQSNEKLKAVRSKYSHRVFFEVAKLPPLDVLKLEEVS
ncbi:G2/mitotic-specific cyclin-B3 isoform X1 [Bufo gargarizans]|uniref:G2/mitotic-specific cyclin-B3 isoform X1 n=1 Tax=Bufo gargarizans TaxID=30331 RepID=UPI001CF0F84B|nr:G2/mitotic-specific cyclin-B3 isoform X1 [Bufo gargarizans]